MRTKVSQEGVFSHLPETNIINVVKFLVLCTSISPDAYNDEDLLLLVLLLARVSLEKTLQLTPLIDFQCLLEQILENIQAWDTKMPELCMTLSDLSAHHHNLLRVVQLLPSFHTRGRQLRGHLSMMIISKLLDERCTYTPETKEQQISHLCHYLVRMKPSALLKSIEAAAVEDQQGELQGQHSMADLDQKAYYLAFNLLTLANEVTHFDVFPSSQRFQPSLIQVLGFNPWLKPS
ncbi:SMC5-SMC6 complex localization factor protein 2 [Latimeria chalumnae]|uniref:SMC5-SMC6 complex localization factor protein 2 n=1 Tax=Latimeria chalumnae TaxID=7897 RepID=UPI00313E0667